MAEAMDLKGKAALETNKMSKIQQQIYKSQCCSVSEHPIYQVPNLLKVTHINLRIYFYPL